LEFPSSIAAGEAFVTLRFYAREAQNWCAANHEVAWEQLELANEIEVFAESQPSGDIDEEHGKPVVVRGGATETIFDWESGNLTSLRFEGVELLQSGLQLQIFRGATDNDGIKGWSGQESKPLGRWLDAGFDTATVIGDGIDVEGTAVCLQHFLSCKAKEQAICHQHNYTLREDGSVRSRQHFLRRRSPARFAAIGNHVGAGAGL
jgi:beta-galactosidase